MGELRAIRDLQARAQPVELWHHSRCYRVLIAGIESPALWIDYADYKDSDRIGAVINLIEMLA